MSKSNALETAWLEHYLNNVAIANVGDTTGLRGSSTAGNLYVAAHTADPGEGGNQTTNECTYGGYARVAIVRDPTTKKWTVTSGTAVNVDDIVFPACTSGSQNITYLSIGSLPSGAGDLGYSGAVTTTLAVSVGITPKVASGQFSISED